MDGDINVLWASPQEVVQGIGRKFYPGETLQLTLGGHVTQNNEDERKQCKVFDWFCKTVRVPAPVTREPAKYPAVFVIVADSGGGTLTPDPIPFGGTTSFTIPAGAPDDFGKAWRLRAMIPNGSNFNRAICVGTYTLRVEVDNGQRLSAFRNYLGAGARTAAALTEVLDERFRTRNGPQIADEMAAHAQARFANSPNPALSQEYPAVLELALDINPGSPALQRKLAAFYIAKGNFPKAQEAALAAARNAKDEADQSQAYLLLGQIMEGERTQFSPGALRGATALYEQAVDLARNGKHRSLLLNALQQDADAQRRIRTRTSLARAAELFERARDAAPAEAGGSFANLNAEAGVLLTTKVRFGFTVESSLTSTTRTLLGDTDDDWLPLAAEPGGNVLVSRNGSSVEWWNPQGKTQGLGSAAALSAVVGNGAALVLDQSQELILMTPSVPQRTVFKGAPQVAVGGGMGVQRVLFFGMAARAEALFWCAAQNRVDIQDYQGTALRSITLGANEWMQEGALSGDGKTFAGVVAATTFAPGAPPNTRVTLRVWNVQDGAPFLMAKDEKGAELVAKQWMPRRGGISFSPDGTRIYWNVDKQLYAIRTQGYVLEKALDIATLAPPPIETPVAVQPPPELVTSHSWVDADTLMVFASADMRPMAELKPLLQVKHSTLAAAATSLRVTYIYPGGMGPFGAMTGPHFLAGSKDGEILFLRSAQKHLTRVYALADGAVHGKAEFQPASNTNYLGVVDGGHTIVDLSPTGADLIDLDSAHRDRINAVLSPPLVDLGHGEWQAMEATMSPFRPNALRRYHGRTETGSAPIPPMNPAADIAGPGKLCAVPNPFFAVTPGWMVYPLDFRQAQEARLVPGSFLGLLPGNYPHNLIDVPMVSLHGELPLVTETRKLLSCARLIALADKTKAALQLIEPAPAPGQPPPPAKLVLAPGEGVGTPLDVLGAVASGTVNGVATAAQITGKFLPDGRSFAVAVARAGQPLQVTLWRYNGATVQKQPCSTCDRPNLAVPDADFSFGPFGGVLFSASGRKTVVLSGDRLVVHDFATNTMQLQMDREIPLALTDDRLVTMATDKTIRIWMF
jgi:hypothetical protein